MLEKKKSRFLKGAVNDRILIFLPFLLFLPETDDRGMKHSMTSENMQGHPREKLTCPGESVLQDYILPAGW